MVQVQHGRWIRNLSVLYFLLFHPSIGTYGQSWQVFDMDNASLPSNRITALAQDGAGIIWAATDLGLCRYDGGEWTVMQAMENGLPDDQLTTLAVDTMDRLWIGTALYGVAVLHGDQWTYYTTDNSPLPDNTINGITHDHRGWTWIATAFGLACITDDGWRIYNDTPQSHMGLQLFGPNVRKAVVRPDDDLVCVATINGGLTYITEEDIIYYTTFNSTFPDNSANDIALDDNGDRWIASPAAGLIRHAGPYEGGPWFNYTVQNSGFPDNTLTSIVIDANGTKYAGTETGGILVYPQNGIWSTYDQNNSGLPDDRVLSLMIDMDGVLWAGTFEGGVARMASATATDDPDGRGVPSIYPVPFDDVIHITTDELPGGTWWDLCDASGRSITNGYFRSSGEAVMLMLDVPPAPYVLTLRNGTRRHAIRLVRIP